GSRERLRPLHEGARSDQRRAGPRAGRLLGPSRMAAGDPAGHRTWPDPEKGGNGRRPARGGFVTLLHRGIAIAVHITFLVVGLGLVVRRRWTLSGFFAAYIAFVLVMNPMVVWWPDHFFKRWFFLIIQPAMDVLKFGIALEVAGRTFRPFPGTRSPS